MIAVGNSAARSAIRPEAVASQTGRWRVLAINDSTGPTWYAALKYQVFGAGMRPARVVLAGAPGAIFSTGPQSSLEAGELLRLAGTQDHVLVEGTRGTRAWDRLAYRAGLRRASWRRGIVSELSVDTAKRLFPSLRKNTVMLFQAQPLPEWTVLPPLEATFVPEIAQLVAAYGAELVVVRIRSRDEAPTMPSPDAAAFARYGVRYIDEPGAYFDASAFLDATHLTPRAGLVFTGKLARALEASPRHEPAP